MAAYLQRTDLPRMLMTVRLGHPAAYFHEMRDLHMMSKVDSCDKEPIGMTEGWCLLAGT